MERERSIPTQVSNAKPDRWDRHLIILSRLFFAFNLLLALVGTVLRLPTIGWIDYGLLSDFEFSLLTDVIVTYGSVIATGVVGLLILSKYPRNVVGWLLLILSFSASFLNFSTTFGLIYAFSPASRANPLVEFFAWTTLWSWLPFVLIPLFFFPLFFPDGRLLSRRWRIVVVAAVINLILIILLGGLYTDAIEHPGSSIPNPYHLTRGEDLVNFLNRFFLGPVGLVLMIATFASPILRYRRAGGVQRAQMKWIFFTLMLGIAFFLSFGSLAPLLTNASEEELAPISNGLFWLFTIAIPIVMGIAILRYQLFDIDLIIRRTLVYGALTILLAVIYLGVVTLLQSLVSAVSGQESPLIIVISTLTIAALFAPLRRRVQRFIDRRFYRRKYDATQTLAQFAATARDEVDLDQLTAELARVVDKTMQPESVSIWLKDR